MAGLHIAQQDSSSMILFLGLPASDTEDREAFQEVETKSLLGTFVKWVGVIRETKRIPEYVSRAFHVAQSGRPGPVVLGLPEDMLAAMADVADAQAARVMAPEPPPAAMAEVQATLAGAKQPLMIVGGPGWSGETRDRVQDFARRFDMPVVSSFRCQDYFDNRLETYVGHAGVGMDPTLAKAITDADVLFVVGSRLGEMTTNGYTLIDIPNPKQKLVHVHPSGDELGTVYRADVPVVASAETFSKALEQIQSPPSVPWSKWREERRNNYTATLKPADLPGDVHMGKVINQLSDAMPDNAIICNGAGNYAAFLHRHFTYKGFRTQLAPTSGSMGYGLPAGVAAKVAFPDRPSIVLAGDGCFMMTCQELATCMQYDLPVIVIVANNGMYGTIRMHQEREYPERVVGTRLTNPDFAKFAESFGGHGETVTSTDAFRPALDRAIASGKPAVIELKLDPEALTPRQTLSAIRQAAKNK
jgi:acetolactate synthase-1/2/3 large subunit